MCLGVAVARGNIFVSYINYDERVAYIRVYDIEGRDLGKRLGINPDGSSMFPFPDHVAVGRSGDKIFVSDCDTCTVSCLTGDGKLVYQYRDIDDNDNVIICGYVSHTVQVIKSGGLKHKTLLSSQDGISNPECVSFNPSDRTLVVGGENDKLLVYQMS